MIQMSQTPRARYIPQICNDARATCTISPNIYKVRLVQFSARSGQSCNFRGLRTALPFFACRDVQSRNRYNGLTDVDLCHEGAFCRWLPARFGPIQLAMRAERLNLYFSQPQPHRARTPRPGDCEPGAGVARPTSKCVFGPESSHPKTAHEKSVPDVTVTC